MQFNLNKMKNTEEINFNKKITNEAIYILLRRGFSRKSMPKDLLEIVELKLKINYKLARMSIKSTKNETI